MLRVGVFGAAGRMGRAVTEAARQRDDLRVTARIDPKLPDARGEPADVFLDFSTPDAAADHAAQCAESGAALVCCVTGGDCAEREAALMRASERIAVLSCANLLASMTTVRAMARLAAAGLRGFTPVVTERHHAGKRDAPSGTAKWLAADVGAQEKDVLSVRAGTLAGEHEVAFYGEGESVVLLHRTDDRAALARSALNAAAWLSGCAPGYYTIEDMIGLDTARRMWKRF